MSVADCFGDLAEFGDNVRLYHPQSGKRLHYDGADFTLWAKSDGSGDKNDNWTVLDASATVMSTLCTNPSVPDCVWAG